MSYARCYYVCLLSTTRKIKKQLGLGHLCKWSLGIYPKILKKQWWIPYFYNFKELRSLFLGWFEAFLLTINTLWILDKSLSSWLQLIIEVLMSLLPNGFMHEFVKTLTLASTACWCIRQMSSTIDTLHAARHTCSICQCTETILIERLLRLFEDCDLLHVTNFLLRFFRIRLVAVATQKFIAEVASDSLQYDIKNLPLCFYLFKRECWSS